MFETILKFFGERQYVKKNTDAEFIIIWATKLQTLHIFFFFLN